MLRRATARRPRGPIGSGGGFVQIGGASATVVSMPTVSTSVGDNASLKAGNGDITVTSTSYANASADGTNSGGGFVAVGSGDAGVTTTNNNSATLGANDTIVTPGDFTLQANSFHNVLASSDSSGGGAVSIASANTLTTTSDTASAQVGTSSRITAGGNILIQSSQGLVDTAVSNSNGSGLGVNSDAEATTKGSAQATTTVQGGAILNAGGDLRILANQGTGGISSAFATARASAFGVHDVGNTFVTQVYNSDVVVGPSATLSAPDQLQISADVGTPRDTAIGYGDSSAFGGVTDAGAINTVSTHAKVEVAASAPATTMRTGQLVVTANDPGPVSTTKANRTTAFIDFGSGTATPTQPVNEALIDFNANVTISGVELTIDSLGQDPYGARHQRAGQGNRDRRRRHHEPRQRHRHGDGERWRFAERHRHRDVRLLRRREHHQPVVEEPGHLQHRSLPVQRHANLSVSPSKPAGFTTSTTSGGGSINITQTGQGDITLNGAIINPSGTTTVIDQNGSILAGVGESMQTASATLVSTNGSIGTAGNRLNAQLVESSTLAATFSATATQSVYLNLSALNLTNAATALVTGAVAAGQVVDLRIQDGQQLTTAMVPQASNYVVSIGTPLAGFQPVAQCRRRDHGGGPGQLDVHVHGQPAGRHRHLALRRRHPDQHRLDHRRPRQRQHQRRRQQHPSERRHQFEQHSSACRSTPRTAARAASPPPRGATSR